jgi:2-polyprenyl-6-methoxyphenol hydroxylase-like FAD-dependent oxidoreductase
MALGRVAVLGDAAFVARPHCAMGVTKAGLDAESLADALAAHGADLTMALSQYDREAGEFGRRAVARARYLGAHLEAQHKPRELRTPHELSRDPAKWIRESGARLRDVPELFEAVLARRSIA